MELIHKTITQCLQARAAACPDRTALASDEGSYTWRELDHLSTCMAARMLSHGVRKGTHAGIWSTNSPNWIITFLALEKVGAIPVLLNTCYSTDELAQVLDYADVEYVYYGEGYKKLIYAGMVEELKKRLESKVKRWIYIGRDKERKWMGEDSFVFAERMKKAAAQVEDCIRQTRPEETAAMLFTSGTTGSPKGVMLSHDNLVNSSLETCAHMKWDENDRMLIAVPLFHCFGITSSLLSSIHTGFSMYVIEYFKTMIVLRTVQEQRCTLLNGVPSMFLAVVRNPERKNYDLSSLRRGIIAGSPYTREEYLEIRKSIPSLVLHASYGQTETSPCVSIGDVGDTDEENAVSAGRVIEHCEVGIFNLDTCRQVETGETGEIRVRGYNVMQGYYRLPEETAKAIDPDGWLHTGDLGYLDERHFLYMTGRVKELIIRGGENISPVEIENAIRQYPGVKAVKVIGLPVEVLQEMVVACVVPEAGASVSETGLKAFLENRIAYYKIPSHVVLVDELPVTASGKVALGKLKETAAERIREQEQAEHKEK